jgi:hypothetical protein
MSMDTILALLAIMVIAILVLYGIGRVLCGRIRILQIAVMTIVGSMVLLSLAWFGVTSLWSFDFAYPTDPNCLVSSPKCVYSLRLDPTFASRLPNLTLWLLVPKPLRPSCESISTELCMLAGARDFAPLGYIFGAIGMLLALLIVFIGLYRGHKKKRY